LWPNIRRWLVARQRPGRRTIFVLAVLLLLGLGHALILRLLAWPLAAGGSSAECDCFCIHGGELGADGFEPFDAAAAWHGKPAGRKIILLLPRMTRIVEIGAVRSFEQTCLSELGKRGVPPEDIWPIRADARDIWDEIHALDSWLKAHPDSTVSMACSPFTSGRLRYVLKKVVGPANAARVRLLWLPDPGSSVDTWWRSRRGVKDFMYAWLELIFAWVEGDQARPFPVGAATFQQEIRARIGEAPP
jgi:hypothetical protein